MAVLEAFVYDPLINWRLMQTEVDRRRRNEGERACCYLLNQADNTLVDPDRAAELARVTAHPQGPSRKVKANEDQIFNGTFRFSSL